MTKGWYMTDEEIAERHRQLEAADKAPLYQRLLEWPICILFLILFVLIAPFAYLYYFLTARMSDE